MGEPGRNNRAPQFTDHCFTGDYPTALTDLGAENRAQLSLLALGLGVVTGLGAVLFRDLIGFIHNLLFTGHALVHYDANTFTAPATLTWVVGSVHTIATASTQAGAAGTQYIFSGWSDNGGLTHSVTAPVSPATYTAGFKTQYLLTAGVAPANTGVVTGGGVFYDAGANVPVTATPIANFGFAGWNGNVAASGSAATTIAMTAPQSVTANFVLANLPAGYLHYRAITIPHTAVPSDQTNFPVLIQGVFPYLKTVSNGGLVLNTQGNDILFLSDRGQQVNWEVESYNPATGAATFWVQVPTLSSVADTTVYLFYGNPSVTSFQGNKQGTWDSNFAAVYHMSDNSAAPAVSDATANGNNGTSQTSTSARTAVGQNWVAQFNSMRWCRYLNPYL